MLFFKNIASLIAVGSVLTTGIQALSQHVFESQGYRVLSSEKFKGYSVRVKQPTSCENNTQYSGYIDKHDTDDHYFFYFTESRSDPKTDPLVLWLNGGPGCSSMMGLWMELGPCLVNSEGNGTVQNPYSWNTAANVIFLDQPVNVGYSYGKSNVQNTQESARDVYAFLQLFLDEYKQYSSNSFHISGESYAGHYLPAISTEIIEQNKESDGKGLLKINYQSMLIGNGWTNPRTQFKEYSTFGCTNYTKYQPLFDENTCDELRTGYSRCEVLMTACYRFPSPLTCVPANLYCERAINGPFDKKGLNPYDIRVKCQGDTGLCYDQILSIQKYANLPEVKVNLGVDPEIAQYESCSNSVGVRFGRTGDGSYDFSGKVADTLEAGVRVLLYVGEMDWICNWVGNLEWSLNMKWPGQKGYQQAPTEPWYSDLTGQKAGEVRSFGNLTYLKIYEAGHMVPFDQPENALDFFNKWLDNLSLAN
ncbi:Alpha/Beta hydrolase protein [Sporodiniella umbellata]|nr:Alpha/Beta hydrolase protein [Sporodiniella umbellata]